MIHAEKQISNGLIRANDSFYDKDDDNVVNGMLLTACFMPWLNKVESGNKKIIRRILMQGSSTKP